jgi:hypothetical protein
MRKSKERGKGKVVIGNVAFFWCQIFPMTLSMLRFFVACYAVFPLCRQSLFKLQSDIIGSV